MLGEVCRFIDYRGRTPEKTKSGIRLITAKNVKMGFLQRQPLEFVNPNIYDSWMTRGIPRLGDVLFTTEAPLANVAQLDTEERVVFAQRIIILQPVDSILDRTFLKYLLLSGSVQQRIRAKGTGATVQGIKASLLKTVQVEFPNLIEQRRIVGILEEAFDGIASAKANAEKNLQNARSLFESHLEDVFTTREQGWVERRLGDVGKTQYGLSEPMNELGKGFKIFRMGEVQDGRLIDTGRMKFADINQAEFEKYKLYRGDVLFNRTNSFELVGKTGIFNLSGEYCFASYLVRILLNRKVLIPEFLNYFMNSRRFQNSVKRKASKSINQANINATLLSNEFVQFPESIKAQSDIVSLLDSLREESHRLESLYERKLAALEELKTSLLHQAFKGEL
jgi:type I restriction enzyme S subunit